MSLETLGYVHIPGHLSPERLAALRARIDELFREEGERAGSEFKQEPGSGRLANLVDKGEIFEPVIVDAVLLACVGQVLGPRFKLSSFNVRSAHPGAGEQPLHVDSGALPDTLGNSVCNSIWLIDDFTPENGATRVVPGSHQWGRMPEPSHPDEILLTGKAGDLIVMNAHLWHGGSANRSALPRCAMHVFFTRWDKPQQQYQKKWLRAETQARLSARAREVLALDDPLNDELSSAVTGMSGFLK